jgi:GT2 family glycosyltransferase
MLAHPEVAVCGGEGTGSFEVDPPAWLKSFEAALAIGPQSSSPGYVPKDRSYLYGACAVYRKSLWQMLHETNFRFYLSGRKGKKLNSGEDFELCQAWLLAGYKLWYDPTITFSHYMPASRLTWNYFRKLFKAFGRSDLVTTQYLNALGSYSPLRTRIINNYVLSCFYQVYQIIKKSPAYLFGILSNNEGNKNILQTEREFAFLAELLCNRRKYFFVKRSIAQRKEMMATIQENN